MVAEIGAEQVLGRMREQIKEFKVPRRCVVLEELPLSGNGKVDRKKLATVIEGRSGLPGTA